MHLVAALSGGVDSAVAAASLLEAGHSVTGVHLILGSGSRPETEPAAAVAAYLGIDFQVWDLADAFEANVIDYFVSEYQAGRTPNPCLRCNRVLKFGTLLDEALTRGFDGVATGHYARVRVGDSGVELRRGADLAKDQSYVLGVLSATQLSHSLFPLGGLTKLAVRAKAAQLGLPVAAKADSQDICFLPPGGDAASFLSERIADRRGDIIDTDGNLVGVHRGHQHYTIGQRKGLGIGRPAPDGRPRYVVAIDAATNRVVVGQGAQLLVAALRLRDLTWTSPQLRLEPWHGLAQFRAHGVAVGAMFTPMGHELQVVFDQPVKSVAPGQFLVEYEPDARLGDRVVGSGVIASTQAPQ